MKLSKGTLNITLSISSLILFLIIIIVGYVYVARTDEQVDKINATLNKVNASINNFQKNSNHRWNVTFALFDKVANAVHNVANRLQYNQANNLNLTKFNRAGIIDTNIMAHKIWENLTGLPSCLDNPLTKCVGDQENEIASLILNSRTAADNNIIITSPNRSNG